MGKKKIWLSSPTMNGHEMEFIQDAFQKNWVAPLGENVDGFEQDVVKYIDPSLYACAVNAGTAAIHLAVILAGIQEGDTVFVQDLTFGASAFPVSYQKAVPVFIDSEKESWNMDPNALEKAFDMHPEAKAVIAVDLYGTPCKVDEITKICQKHHAVLIVDSAESLGASYKGRKCGSFGDFGILSFNGNKIITTSGGGMLLSHDKNLIDAARKYCTQSREPVPYYLHKQLGYNYRMSNIVAGIGRGQMYSLDEHVARKKRIREIYQKGFEDIEEIHMNPYLSCSAPNYWLSCMTFDPVSGIKPMDIVSKLDENNINTRPIWNPMHNQPVYKNCDYVTVKDDYSVSDDIFQHGVCLPSDIKNTDEDMDEIISIIRSIFGR